jgi:hypothetical protein
VIFLILAKSPSEAVNNPLSKSFLISSNLFKQNFTILISSEFCLLSSLRSFSRSSNILPYRFLFAIVKRAFVIVSLASFSFFICLL